MAKRADSDEHYVLDLCDKVLGITSSRQHSFPFLVGDPGKNGRVVPLRVDAYYAELNLVIEFQEQQHTRSVAHFDKPHRMTVSGVHRGEQRRIYFQRRRDILPLHGIELLEISYSDLQHTGSRRLKRTPEKDKEAIRSSLQAIGKA